MSNLPNSIIYKYNKHIQVNGTIFYAFEYLCQLIENEIMAGNVSKHPETRLYIIIPRKYQKDYLDKLFNLFRTKYPLWNHKVYSDMKNLEKAKSMLSLDKYTELKNSIQVVNKAFNRIRLLTSLELLKKEFNNVLIPNMDSWIELNDYINANSIRVIQNRQVSTIKEFERIPKTKLCDSKVLFLNELEEQSLNIQTCKKYIPKIGFRFMIPKELFSLYPQSDKIVAGNPIANVGIINFGEFNKPTIFAQIKNGIFLNTKLIEYHRDFLRWDENNRIIPEARYFDIKLKIINAFTKIGNYIQNINNIPINKSTISLEDLPEDSSVSRFDNPLKEYTLEKDDPLILFLFD